MSKFTEEEIQKMVYLIKKNDRSYRKVAERFGTTEDEVKALVYKAYYGEEYVTMDGKAKKFFETHIDPMVGCTYRPRTVKYDFRGEETVIRFGLISDTHINSNYTQLTHLHDFYNLCKAEGITEVYHAGDIDEGDQMRMGHQYECYRQGVDQHIDEIVKNYPRIDGIKTYFITGNHDYSIYKRSGIDIGKIIADRRDDMIYLGRDIARVELSKNCSMELRHPYDGGNSSISCKAQKIVDNYVNNKPSILAIGNYHKIDQLYYKGVHVIQTACFQGNTSFTIGKNIMNQCGGWIITVVLDKNGNIKRFIPELIPYDEDIIDDWKNWI